MLNPNPDLPVIHPPPLPLNMEGLTEGAPPTFPVNTNNQGLRGFTIPMGHGPAWEQQLRDTLRARYQRPQPAQQARRTGTVWFLLLLLLFPISISFCL